MSDLSQEPDNYSLDDMMERLKRPSPTGTGDQGELVTRVDGSRAVRVRKRKRRSYQPHKDEAAQNRRLRIIQVSAALLLLLLSGLTAAGALIFGNSPFFRNRLLEGARFITGSKLEIREFRINPKTANASYVAMTWPGGNVLRELQARSLQAEILPSSFLGKSLNGDEITAGQVEVFLDFPEPSQPRAVEAAPVGRMNIRFKRYATNKLRLVLGSKTNATASIRDSEFVLQDRGPATRPQLIINRGTLQIPECPLWRIDRGHIEFRGDDIDMVGLRLLHETDTRGYMKLSGIIQPYSPDRKSTLAVQLDDFPLDGLVGAKLGKLFTGRVGSTDSADSNYFSFTPASETRGSLALAFEKSPSSSFEVSGFPAFALLARLLEDKWFERPVFDSNVQGTIRRNVGEVILEDLTCENRNRMSLRAHLRLTKQGSLSGTLRIGITDPMLKSSASNRIKHVFKESLNGFHWVELTVTGHTDAPRDNFAALYDAASADPVGRTLPGSSTIPSFEDLTTPPVPR